MDSAATTTDAGVDPAGVEQRGELAALELPSMTPFNLVRQLGPGLVLMMAGVGTSHLVTAPVAGGRFEYALLWCIAVAYVCKYYGFEMAFRFTHATGKSMLDAYATSWKKLPVWYVLVATIMQAAVGQAGRLIAAAAVVFFFCSQYLGLDIPFLPDDRELVAYGFVLAVASVMIILAGRYPAVELATKIAAGIMIVSTVAVYAFEPAPSSAFVRFFELDTPDGSWLIIASLLGLLPAGIDVSLPASEWCKAKNTGMGRIRERLEQHGLAARFDPFTSDKRDLGIDTSRLPIHALEYCRRWFKIGLWDFRVGHIISFLIATVFLLLAAIWLYPSDVQGNAVSREMARVFNDGVGPQMMIIFLLAAFAATFSAVFNYFDGWPRVVGACCRNLFRRTAALSGTTREDLDEERRRTWCSEYNIYRATMIFSLIASVTIIAGLPRPVYLVLIAAALAYFVAPIIFFLNLYYCFTAIPKNDTAFYPSKLAAWLGWSSLAVFAGMSVILVLQSIFGIGLFA